MAERSKLRLASKAGIYITIGAKPSNPNLYDLSGLSLEEIQEIRRGLLKLKTPLAERVLGYYARAWNGMCYEPIK